ncbi:uncharacterized protein LOC112564632 [Pomacea canaliculata]|uniref:uncharacterized protein LOC112564632 n=1 Tax=Pomacea canaliculata TaxID=400727 RepID=UPI000D7317B1|nr:uncharacterized protein LOC112564632 [Pomacea canaliculata]
MTTDTCAGLFTLLSVVTMRKVQVLILLVISLLPHTDAFYCACAKEAVNVRLGPGTNYPKVSTLYPGYCLMYHRVILLSGGYYWMKVVYDGQNAWVASNWVSVTPCEKTSLY